MEAGNFFGKELPAMTYPYILPPLPYAPAALEPNLGRSSVRLHHDAFFAAYVDRCKTWNPEIPSVYG